jgi:purine-cytosine permease-like protein
MTTHHSGVADHGREGIEQRGVDYIPDKERHSTPWNLAAFCIGAQFCFNLFVLGWLPISFGLGWWSSLTSITVGLAIGTALYAPMALFGGRTGTNTAVSSGAHFGVVGRLLGTVIAMFIGIGFFGLVVWSGGEAIAGSVAKLFDVETGDGLLAAGYAVMGLITLTLAIYGHDKVVAAQKFVTVVVGACLLIGVVALAGSFDAVPGGDYLLGSFWSTWILGVVTAASVPISYAPFVNDYTRYISRSRYSDRTVLWTNGIAMFVGCWIVLAFGAYVGTMAALELGPIGALVDASPTWFLLPVLVIALIGGVAQGAVCIYGTGLDTSSLIPSLSRAPATLLLGLVGIAIVYLGAFAFDAIALVSAFVVILTIVTAPWMVILIMGFVSRRGWYDPRDLQVFNAGMRGGRYWFSSGWNMRAFAAWIPAVVVGFLMAHTTEYTGPWADWADGIDISIPVAMVIAAVIYAVALRVFPESPEVLGDAPASEPVRESALAAALVGSTAADTTTN